MSFRAKVVAALALFVHSATSAIITDHGIVSSRIAATVNYTGSGRSGLTRTALSVELSCYELQTAELGVKYIVRSSNFPEGLTRGGDQCHWNIRIPPHSRIQVHIPFIQFPCEAGHSLVFDYGRPHTLCPDYGDNETYPIYDTLMDFPNIKSESSLLSIRYRSHLGSEKVPGFAIYLYLIPLEIKPIPERPKCGTKLTKKIVGGSIAEPEDYPWKAFLLMYSAFGSSTCGATLISDTWLMTAAHCVDNAWIVYAFTGCNDTEDLLGCDQHFSIFDKRDIFIHEDWNPDNVGAGNDIALLRLSTPAQLNDRTRLICLPTLPRPNDLTQIQAAGWGKTCEDCEESEELMQTSMQVLDNSDCIEAWSTDDEYQLSDKILCTTNGTGHVYFGDSGGFGGWRRPDGRYEQLGIVSFGPEEEYSEIPIVFTSVYDYMIWIYQTMQPFNE